VLAGCGGGERAIIPPETAEALAQRSEQVAEALERGDPCEADRLADELVQAGETADVPASHREELLASARSLADRIECPPPPPLPTVEEPDRDNDEDDEDEDDDDDGKGKGKGKGKKKGKGRG
jgi:hypothetical protein